MYTVDNWIIATISAFVSLVATTAITAIVSTVIKKVVEKKLDGEKISINPFRFMRKKTL